MCVCKASLGGQCLHRNSEHSHLLMFLGLCLAKAVSQSGYCRHSLRQRLFTRHKFGLVKYGIVAYCLRAINTVSKSKASLRVAARCIGFGSH